jgi:hypothetical protein
LSTLPATIVVAKEYAPLAFPPVLFYAITFFGTSVTLYLCDKNDATHDYLTYDGNQYLSRVKAQQIGPLQAFSTMGFDTWPDLTITLADPDAAMFDYEQNYGYAGARLTATIAFWDPVSGNFSSDSIVKFTGICDPAQLSETTSTSDIKIRAVSDFDLSRKVCPTVPVQRICPWAFPSTAAQRAGGLAVRNGGYQATAPTAANQPFVIYSNCGYSPDQAGGLGVYQSGTTPFTTCPHTKSGCQERGMYGQQNGNTSGQSPAGKSFGGVQWDPPGAWTGNSYTAQQLEKGFNTPNLSKYSDRVPETYGATWVTCVVCNVCGDPNSTRFECLVQYLPLGHAVFHVLVNSVLIPTLATSGGGSTLFWWQPFGNGGAQGAFNTDDIYNTGNALGNSDPYGSMAMIEATVISQLQSSVGVPTVQAYVGLSNGVYVDKLYGNNGRPIPVWTSTTSWSLLQTDLTAWVLLDLLMRYLPSATFDIDSFIAAGSDCAGAVTYTDLTGNTSAQHRRFGVSLTIDRPTALSQVILGLRMSSNIIIRQSYLGNAISCLVKKTLGEQQGSMVPGSNYNTAVASTNWTGGALNGYYAYWFHEGTYLDAEIKITQQPLNSTPNAINAAIQDEDNQNQADTVLVGDVEAVARSGRIIQSSFTAIGFPNYDQANRVLNTYMAEQFRGNFYGGPGATLRVTIQSTVRVVHLNSGDIVALTYQRLAWSMVPMRIMSITPAADFETATIELQYHDDGWYQDDYGQSTDPLYSSTGGLNVLSQVFPYPWQPNWIGNVACDQMYGEGMGVNHFMAFAIQAAPQNTADGIAVSAVTISGLMPQNVAFSVQPPLIDPVGATATTGGSIAGGFTYYIYLAGYNGTNWGPCARLPCVVNVPSGTETNTITIQIQYYPPGTTGVQVYIGTAPNYLVLAATYAGTTPSSVTLTSQQSTGQGPVDLMLKSLEVRAKQVPIPGRWMLTVVSTTSTTILVTGTDLLQGTDSSTWAAGALDGADMICASAYIVSAAVPFLSLHIASSSAPSGSQIDLTIDMSSGSTDLTTLPLSSNVFFAMQGPSAATVNTMTIQGGITSSPGLLAKAVGNYLRIIDGTGRLNQPVLIITADYTTGIITFASPLTTVPDASTRWIIENAAWEATSAAKQVSNSAPATSLSTLNCALTNYSNVFWYVEVLSLSANGIESIDIYNPYRFLYTPGYAGPGSGGSGLSTKEYPTGTINSSNTVFTLSVTPSALLMVFRNGLLLELGVHYTVTGSTITFANAPLTGDWLVAYF